MLDSTIELIRAGLKTDPTLSSDERTRLLAILRNHGRQTPSPPPTCQEFAPKVRRVVYRVLMRLISKRARFPVFNRFMISQFTGGGAIVAQSTVASGALSHRGLPF